MTKSLLHCLYQTNNKQQRMDKMADKKLTWAQSWGKVDWKNITEEQLKELIAKGADVFMLGKDAKGRVGFPINFLEWTHPNMDVRSLVNMTERERRNVDMPCKNWLFLRLCMVTEIYTKHKDKMLVYEAYDEADHVIGRYRYDEQAEMKKENWIDLDWAFVSPEVISEMVKKGLDVNDRMTWTQYRFNRKVSSFSTPLHFACSSGNL